MAPSGDVYALGFVHASDQGSKAQELYRFHAGSISDLGPNPAMVTDQIGTDGINLVADSFPTDLTTPATWAVVSLSTLRASALPGPSPVVPSSGGINPYTSYANGGWTAYVLSNQVWVQSPSGTDTQLSIFNSASTVDAVATNGEVMFLNSGDPAAGVPSGRYLRIPPGLPGRINSQLGFAVPGCDDWYVRMGGTLFSVAGTADAGSGCVSPVSPDAGVDGSTTADATVDGTGGSNLDSGTEGSAGLDGETPAADGSVPPAASGGGQGHSGASQAGASGGCAITGPCTASGEWLAGIALLLGALSRRRGRPPGAPDGAPGDPTTQ
jgi:hypothetical protein